MKNKIALIILQYNVRNERVRTMISLLIDDNIQNFDVIAIQKFWRNLFVSITLSFSQSDFHLLYKFGENTKVCFYVNNELNTNSWNVEYSTIDICTLKMKINELDEDSSTIHIHNVYNLSLIFYSSRDSSSTLSKTRKSLVDALTNHHILLEDFNLHHFFWSDSSKSTQHAAANELLDIVKEHDLTLTLFKKFITWKNRIAASIIDLTFMTTHLIDKLEHCTTRSDLNQSSNHISISIRILCEIESNSSRISRRAWKSIDLKKIKEAEKNASTLSRSSSTREIDEYVCEVQKFLQSMMKKIVFWAILSRYAKFFWIKECDDAVRNIRRLRRRWSFTQNLNDWSKYMKTNDRKQKIIQKVKRINFRQEIEKTIDISTSLWRLAKWAKDRNHLSREIFKMLILKFNDRTIDTFEKKIDMFKSVFFSASSSIDLIDISRFFYSNSIECSSSITKAKILTIIKRFVLDKISNFDDFINKLLKTCALIMIKLLTSLFETCIQLFYHSKTFKEANTITLKKAKKNDYIISKTYRFITLLNIMSKIMKSIMSRRIAWLTKTYRLLSNSHMRCRKNRSIESTLKLLTKQIHIVWDKNTNRIAILLSLDVIETFDTISHERLIHDLRKRRISKWIIDWVINFLQNRTTILTMNRRMIASFSMRTKTFQRFSLFFVLYLFYNVDLLKMCDKFEINTKFLRYADDVNILIYDKSTNENCRSLKRVHKFCEKWATRHEFLFVSIKYELIHFIRNSKKFDMTITIKIESSTMQSKIDIRVLRIQIDIRLKWDSHVRKVQKKMIRQFMIFTKMSTFTWDVIFRKFRVLYTFVIRSVLIYETTIWHTLKTKKTKIISKLAVIQNRCFRSIFEVFRVTLISILEIETHVFLIDLHLNQLQAHARYRMRIEDMSMMIRRECDKITHKLSTNSDRFRTYREISDEFKRAWAKLQLFTNQRSSTNVVFVSWANQTRFNLEQWKFHRQRKRKIDAHHVVRWKQKWKIYCDIVFTSISTQTENIDKKRLQLHDQLRKIESSLSTQIRIEKIDFVDFLFRRKIFEVTSISCWCDWDNQTIKHVIMFCELMNDKSSMLSVVDITDYHQMMTSSKRLKIIIKWLLRHDLLSQFALTTALLYEH